MPFTFSAESLFQRNLLLLFTTAAQYDSEKMNRCSINKGADQNPQSITAASLYNASTTVTEDRSIVDDSDLTKEVPMISEAEVVTVSGAGAVAGANDSDSSDDSSGSSGSSSDDDSDDDESSVIGGDATAKAAVVDTTVHAADTVATSVSADASAAMEVGISGSAVGLQPDSLLEEDSSSGSDDDDDDEASTVQGETVIVGDLETAPVVFAVDEKAAATAEGDSSSDSDSDSSDDDDDDEVDVKDTVTVPPVDAVQLADGVRLEVEVEGAVPVEAAESSDDESGSSSDEDSDEEEIEAANQGVETPSAVSSTDGSLAVIDREIAQPPSVSAPIIELPAPKREEAAGEDDSSSSDSESDTSGTETETEEDEKKKALRASTPAPLTSNVANTAAVNADDDDSSSASDDDSSDAEEDTAQLRDDTAPVPVPSVQQDTVAEKVTKDAEDEIHETVTIFGVSNGAEDSSSDDDSEAETEDEVPEIAAAPAVVTAPVAVAVAVAISPPVTTIAPAKIASISSAPKDVSNESDSSSSSGEEDSGNESVGGNQQAPKKPPLALMVCRYCHYLTVTHRTCNIRQLSNDDNF